MPARDTVYQDERVEHPEPQRPARIDAVPDGQARYHIGEGDHRRERDRPHPQHPGDQMGTGHPDHGGGQPEEHRPVRRRRAQPQRVHLRDQRVAAQRRRTDRVRVQPPADQRALCQIAVHVAAEQRRGKHQRRGPAGEHGQRPARLPGQRGAQPQPGADEHDEPGHRAHHAGGRQPELVPHRGGQVEGSAGGQRTGGQPAHGQRGRADETDLHAGTLPDRGGGPAYRECRRGEPVYLPGPLMNP